MSELKQKALQLYIYAFPLIATEATHFGADDTAGFAHLRVFPDSGIKRVVKMNMDTLYSAAWTQLARTPYTVHIPKIGDRYYLFPIMDAYTNVVESIGTRTPDKAEGDYILLYRDDPVPEGYESHRVIRLENSLNSILLRIETRGKKDYEKINGYQDQFDIRPVYPEKVESVPPAVKPPKQYLEEIGAEEYFELFDRLAADNPIADEAVRQAADVFGIGAGKFVFAAASDDVKAALTYALEEGLNRILRAQAGEGELVISNGWVSRFKDLGVYGNKYGLRAAVSYYGWGANIPQDSAYATLELAPDGGALKPDRKYRIRFEKDGFPHAAYFWSLTLYGSESQYPVENRIGRYAINTYDLQDGNVELNEDGSLDIFVSNKEPEDVLERKNWLPAPENESSYSLVIRIYWPDAFTLAGKWEAPVVTQIQ